jgi:anionic cell wall polymer biosynthesis LytR-Cps2A-Psr (LCP) family protein
MMSYQVMRSLRKIKNIRNNLYVKLYSEGLEKLLDELRKVDAQTANAMDHDGAESYKGT